MMRATRQVAKRTGRRHAPAFTLIELLVVVAIVSLLASILLPALRQSRIRAQRLACQANLRELAIAWEHYLNDHHDRFLKGVNTNWNYGGQWGMLPPYQRRKPLNTELGLDPLIDPFPGEGPASEARRSESIAPGAKVFRCPADRGGANREPTYFAWYGTSYRTNELLIGQDSLFVSPADPCADVFEEVNERIKHLTRSQVTVNPSRVLLMGDAGWALQWQAGNPWRAEWHDAPAQHNVAFLDGHVEFVKIRKGLHTTPAYDIVPFRDLLPLIDACQEEDTETEPLG